MYVYVGITNSLKADHTNDTQPNNSISQTDSHTDSTLIVSKEVEAMHLDDRKFICMCTYLPIINFSMQKV